MRDFVKNKAPFLILVPTVVAVVWAFMAYNIIIVGVYPEFASLLLPFSIILFLMYFFGLYFWYKIEQSEYRKRIDILEMDINALFNRVDTLEMKTIDNKYKKE